MVWRKLLLVLEEFLWLGLMGVDLVEVLLVVLFSLVNFKIVWGF